MGKYKFDEEKTTYYNGRSYECRASKKYAETKANATKIIDSGEYGLTENDFWTLKQYNNDGVCLYNGLIISHNGCLKINDKLKNPFLAKCCNKPESFTYYKKGKDKSVVEVHGYTQTYVETRPFVQSLNALIEDCNFDEIYEVGEISTENLKNDYPFAMLYKRLFDRVILKKSKLAFMGILSEAEVDDKEDKTTALDMEHDAKKRAEITEKFKKLPIKAQADILNVMHKTSPDEIDLSTLEELVLNAK